VDGHRPLARLVVELHEYDLLPRAQV
jgi:hypothetical protein